MSKKENESVIIEQTLKNEVDKFESLLGTKNLVESDVQAIIKDTQMIEEKQRLVDEDLNSMNGQIKKQKKQSNDLKERLTETDLRMKEARNNCYDREEEIKNAENLLKVKDNQLDESNHTINNLDNEVNIIAKEEERLKDHICQVNEQIKEAGDYLAEMMRKKNMLLKEKQSVEENLGDLENETNKFKMELNKCQGDKIAQENELKHMQSVYLKMKSENGKLLDELHEFTKVDEKVRKMLSREERARDIKENAEKEMKVAAHLIKEPY